MVDLMGGSDSVTFAEFEDLCVLAFLAVRLKKLALSLPRFVSRFLRVDS
jgi:hypothetical protein